MSSLKYTVTYIIDKDFLCDQETIDKDFNGSWQEFIDWMAKDESYEVMTGFGGYPESIEVIK